MKNENDDTIQVSLEELILAQLSEWIPDLVHAEIREFLGRDSGKHQADDQEAVAALPKPSEKPYRSGYHTPPDLGLGTSPVKLLPDSNVT